MIDIGVNINHPFLLEDLDMTLHDMKNAGVSGMICIASDLEESALIQGIASEQKNIWNTVGCHPHQAKTWSKLSKQQVSDMIKLHFPVAIGETGLDFNRNYSTPDEQFYAFDEQIELAIEHNLPLYLHERDAHQAMIDRLKPHPDLTKKSVIHCFTGDRKTLENYLELGLFIGVTGWVCDERRGEDLQAAIPHIPMNKLLLETDAPYLLPRTIRPRPKKNHPKYLPWVAKEVARLKGVEVEEIQRQTIINTRSLFGINVL